MQKPEPMANIISIAALLFLCVVCAISEARTHGKQGNLSSTKKLTNEGKRPIRIQRMQAAGMDAPPTFGSNEMKREFYPEENYTNLNHGSYGSTPKKVLLANFQHQVEMESSPDEWFRVNVYPRYDQSRKMLASLIGSKDENSVVIVENASNAINAIFRSYQFKSTDKIIYFNTAYGMVKKVLEYIHDTYGVELVEVKLTLDDIQSQEAIIKKVQEVSLQHKDNAKIAVMCHIVSTPAIKLPVKELVQFYKSLGIATVVDGAHAVGNIPLDVSDIGADYYLSNGHKWLFTPKSGCLLWKNPNATFQIHPTIISFYYTTNPLDSYQKEFAYIGTRDYSSYLSVKDAIEYRQYLGGEEKIMTYNTQMAKAIGDMYSKMFGTFTITSDDRLSGGSLVNIKLPFSDSLDFWTKVQSIVLEKYRSYVVVFEFEGKMYCRISAQIYNSLEDYQRIGKVFYETAKTMNGTTATTN